VAISHPIFLHNTSTPIVVQAVKDKIYVQSVRDNFGAIVQEVVIWNEDLVSVFATFHLPMRYYSQAVSAYSEMHNMVYVSEPSGESSFTIRGISLDTQQEEFFHVVGMLVTALHYDSFYDRLILVSGETISYLSLHQTMSQSINLRTLQPDTPYIYSGLHAREHVIYSADQHGQTFGTHSLHGTRFPTMFQFPPENFQIYFINPSTACGGRGVCVENDQCECPYGLTGHNCDLPMCYGDTSCAFGGVCVAPNTCQCSPFFEGDFCETSTCQNSTKEVMVVQSSDAIIPIDNFDLKFDQEYLYASNDSLQALGIAATDRRYRFQITALMDQPGCTLNKYDYIERQLVQWSHIPFDNVLSLTFSNMSGLILVAANETHTVIQLYDPITLQPKIGPDTTHILDDNYLPFTFGACARGHNFYLAVKEDNFGESPHMTDTQILRFNLHTLNNASFENFTFPAPTIHHMHCSDDLPDIYFSVKDILVRFPESDPEDFEVVTELRSQLDFDSQQYFFALSSFVHPRLPHWYMVTDKGALIGVNTQTRQLIHFDVVVEHPPDLVFAVLATSEESCPQIPLQCFGVDPQDPFVCSGRGNCSAINVCDCASGYMGEVCQFSFCFGNQSGSPGVCSGHGTCLNTNNCSCDPEWAGQQCELTLCFGELSTSPQVCNGHGACLGHNICACDANSTGIACEHSICFGIPSNFTDSVCSSHGSCISANNCSCIPSYAGSKCDVPVCYGEPAFSGSVCSTHGTCSSPDSCDCDVTHAGPKCEHTYCYGILSNESNVCSSHGSCDLPDTCTCSAGFESSPNCSITSCYGIPSSDTTNVCSQHGSCENVNLCDCDAGYTGVECDAPICFGIGSTTPSVCSSRGLCVGPDDCSCSTGYSGSKCEHLVCFGVLSNETSIVCSNHGSCIAPDTCSCAGGYASFSDCSIPSCFGYAATSANVCSGHGTCSSPDLCECQNGYSGDSCELTSCFGLVDYDYYVCSEHGQCTAPDVCQCESNFIGSDCGVTSCFGTLSNETSVCNGRGTCVNKDFCECFEGFEGAQCENYFCDGLHFSDPLVCNQRGNCTDQRICTCETGYAGAYCDLYSCFGLPSKNPSVCFGHGVCSAIDNCDCTSGYAGTQCGSFTCFGIAATNTGSVCNGHGSCANIDVCSCLPGQYTGSECQYPMCYGIASTSPSVCNGHGTCLGVDSCTCNAGYTRLADCEKPECFGKLSNESSACWGQGSCEAPDSCLCNEGYFSAQCDDFSCHLQSRNSPSVCSSHGNCTALDTCVCAAGYTGSKCDNSICFGKVSTDTSVCSGHGSCAGPDSCTCQTGWAGSQCASPICFGRSTGLGTTPCNGFPCSGPDQCSCTGQFKNADCSVPFCFGEFDSRVVCSKGRGVCSAPDVCSCTGSNYGTNCEYTSRFFLDIQNSSSAFITNVDEYVTGRLALNTDKFKFYGQSVSELRIGENGFMSFGSSFFASTLDVNTYSGPDPLVLFGLADMDLNGAGATNRIYWRQSATVPTASDQSDLQKITTFIRSSFASDSEYSQFTASWFWVTSADKIGYYPSRTDVVNSVQVILACDETREYSFVIFNFKDSGLRYPTINPKIGLVPTDVSTNNLVDLMTFVDPSLGRSSQMVFKTNTNSNGFYIFPSHLGQIPTSHEYIPTCFGSHANESTVCGGAGNCTADDVCICEKFHKGDQCEISCADGVNYSGESCEVTMCSGLKSFDINVCSGHGTCVGPQNCSCTAGYYGSDCSNYDCYGILKSNATVCSGHGACSSPDTCVCSTGWVHNTSISRDDCPQYTCGGRLPSVSGACANGGDCIGLDQCTGCDLPFFGDNCREAYRYVDAVNGDDSGGANLCLVQASPCKSIQQAISVSFGRNIISLASGTYTLSVASTYLTKSLFFVGVTDEVYISTSANQASTTPSFIVHLQENLEFRFTNIKLKNVRSRNFIRLHYCTNTVVSFDKITATNMNSLVTIEGNSRLMISNSSFSQVTRHLIVTLGTLDTRQNSYVSLSNVTVNTFSNPSTDLSTKGLFFVNYVSFVSFTNVTASGLHAYTSGVHISNAQHVSISCLTVENSTSTRDVCALSVNNVPSIILSAVSVSGCETYYGSGVMLRDVVSSELSGLSLGHMTMRSGSALHIERLNSTNIPSLQLSNLVAYTGAKSVGGGGLYVKDTTLLLQDLSVQQASGVAGMGLYAESSHLTLLRPVMKSLKVMNQSIEFLALQGGAIISTGIGSISINNGTFDDNDIALIVTGFIQTQVQGSNFTNHKYGTFYSIDNRPTSYMLIRDCSFENNDNANGFGGAITSFEGYFQLVVHQCSFKKCSSVHGGAIALLTQSSLLLSSSQFESCQATTSSFSSGGAIHFDTLNSTSIVDCDFLDNKAQFAGAIQFKNVISSRFFLRYGGGTVQNCRFTNNTATADGGALLFTISNIGLVKNCVFDSNHAQRSGGALYADGSMIASSVETNFDAFLANASFAELLFLGNSPGLIVQNSSFIRNSAEVGGALTSFSNGVNIRVDSSSFVGNQAFGEGGSLYLLVLSVSLHGSIIQSSTAYRGGCIFVLMVLDGVGLQLESTTVQQCITSQEGSIYLSTGAELIMNACTLSDSQAILGNIYSSSAITLNGSTLARNTATRGGAVALENDALLTAENVLFDSNTATEGGALFITSYGLTSLSGVTMVNNRAAMGGGIFMGISSTNTKTVPAQRPISIVNSAFSNIADIGGSFFSYEAGYVNWTHILQAKKVDGNKQVLSNSTVVRIAPVLGYGDQFASNPKNIRLRKLIRYDISNTGGASETQFNSTDEAIVLFPGQEVDLYLEFTDYYDQVVSYYPGLTMKISGSSRIRTTAVERVIENEEVVFPKVLIYGEEDNVVEFSGGGISGVLPLSIQFIFRTCPHGYRLTETNDECQRCPRGSYNIIPGSTICYSNCDGFDCSGGSSISLQPGMWLDMNATGSVRGLPCPNGKCSGGDFELTNSYGTELPFETQNARRRGVLTHRVLSSGRYSPWLRSLLDNTTETQLFDYGQYRGSACTDNRQGILCAQCIKGFDEWRGACVPCTESSILLLVLYVLYTLAMVGYVHHSSQNDNDGASTKILVSFVQTALQTIDLSTWASKQVSSLNILGVITNILKAMVNLEIPSFSSPDTETTEYDDSSSGSASTSFYQRCPFERKGYWFFGMQLLQHVATVILIFVAMFLCLIAFKCYKCCMRIKASRARKRAAAKVRREEKKRQRDLEHSQQERIKVQVSSQNSTSDILDPNHSQSTLSLNGQNTRVSVEGDDDPLNHQPMEPEEYKEELLFEKEEREQREAEEAKLLKKKVSIFQKIFALIRARITMYIFPHAFVRTFINILIYTYMPLVNVTFSFLLGCFATSRGKYVLIARTDLECWTTAEYWTWAILFIPAFIYIFVGPVILALFLAMNKKRLHTPKFMKYFGTLYSLYTPNMYWFELVNFMRRTLLVGAAIISNVLILSYNVSGVQYILYTLIISANYLILLRYDPYRIGGDNRVEKLSMFMLLVMMSVQEGTNELTESVGMLSSLFFMVVTLAFLIYWVFRENPIVKKIQGKIDSLINKIRDLLQKKPEPNDEEPQKNPYLVDLVVSHDDDPEGTNALVLNNFMNEDASSGATTEEDEDILSPQGKRGPADKWNQTTRGVSDLHFDEEELEEFGEHDDASSNSDSSDDDAPFDFDESPMSPLVSAERTFGVKR